MPKILINETDKTTPGTPGSYDNFAVLITGFAGTASNSTSNGDPLVKADPNNAYEFKSAQAFRDTIGLVPPVMSKVTEEGSYQLKHYGNQMAYELLRSGFPIIYKSLGNFDKDYKNFEEVVTTLTSTSLWEPFKDKANYDFRFVTHGLLASSGMPANTEIELAEAKAQRDTVDKAIQALQDIADKAELKKEELETDPDFEISQYKIEEYLKIASDYTAFTDPATGKLYGTYDNAFEGTQARSKELEQIINRISKGYFTTDHLNQVNANIANLAQYVTVENPTNKTVFGRGDCIALIELDERCYTTSKGDITDPIDLIISGINEMEDINNSNGKYCAMTVPSVTYQLPDNYTDFANNKTFPGAFHYLTCFINSMRLGFAEWYATAGYTRGVSNYKIDNTTVKLGEIAINALEPRNIIDSEKDKDPQFACNVIANFRGSYYLWGNRTAHPLGKQGSLEAGDLVASSFLNIRQLCITIKKQLYVACRTFTFDPNSDALWVNFVNAIRPTLETMKADQGIRDYKILKVTTDTKATLKAKISIIPIEAVEDFDLEVYLEDSFGETTSTIYEIQ